MQRFLSLVLLCVAHSVFAQIRIAEYPRKFSCEVDGTHALEVPMATSECGEVSAVIEEAIFSGGCLGTLVRTITYRDSCGNTSSAEQYIQLTDHLGPQLFGVPDDIITQEGRIPPASLVSARDNSGEIVGVEINEKREGSTIIRTWTSIDPCGNITSEEQRITIVK